MAKKKVKKKKKSSHPFLMKLEAFPSWTRAVVYSLLGFIFFVEVGLYAGLFTLQLQYLEQAQAVELPKEYLRRRALEEGIDYEMLENIAFCESRWKMVKNSKSSAYGYFQIIDGTEKTTPQYQEGERKYDPYTNIEMGIHLYKTRGTNPWNPSRGCWSRL